MMKWFLMGCVIAVAFASPAIFAQKAPAQWGAQSVVLRYKDGTRKVFICTYGTNSIDCTER